MHSLCEGCCTQQFWDIQDVPAWATVTVTDTIPQHTTYVEGSADHNGVYANGAIVWKLEVEAGAEVTVSFKVKVADANGVAITNKAVVMEGQNTYTTNEVLTPHTPEPPVNPEAPVTPEAPDTPDNPTNANPQTGDTHLMMWFALLFISCGGFVTVAMWGKKKEEQF